MIAKMRCFSLLLLLLSMFSENGWALRCDTVFSDQRPVYQSIESEFRGRAVAVHQLQGETDVTILARDLAPEIPEDRKIIVGFYNGHIYLHHNGEKADSWGRPPFKVSAKPKKSKLLIGQMFLVLEDKSGLASVRFHETFEQFKDQHDFTCVRLACQFMKDVYPQAGIEKQLTPEQFLSHILKWQSDETYSAQIYVTGSDSFNQALAAQKTNQIKTIRNAAVGMSVGLGIPAALIYTLSKILF